MPWKNIDGYKDPYRINEDGVVQKFWRGKWMTLTPYWRSNHGRICVKMRTPEGKPKDVPIVTLMADAFMGGRRPGYVILHKDGQRTNNALWNLKFGTRKDCGKMSRYSRRRAVVKIDASGEVVELYRSATEAAEKNFISRSLISLKCNRKVKDTRRTDGYDYQWEDMFGRKKQGKKPAAKMDATDINVGDKEGG